jgi:hypothetical protein
MYRRTLDAMLQAWEQPGVLASSIAKLRYRRVGAGPKWRSTFTWANRLSTVGIWHEQPGSGLLGRACVEAGLTQFRTCASPQRPPGTPFLDAAPLGEDAAPIDRLAAYLGRDVGAWST